MTDYASTLYSLLIGFDLRQFFTVLFNQYFPYGLFFWMVGFVIFAVTQLKTKNLPFASVLMAFYFVAMPYTGLVANIYSATAMQFAGGIIGIVVGVYMYKAWRG